MGLDVYPDKTPQEIRLQCLKLADSMVTDYYHNHNQYLRDKAQFLGDRGEAVTKNVDGDYIMTPTPPPAADNICLVAKMFLHFVETGEVPKVAVDNPEKV